MPQMTIADQIRDHFLDKANGSNYIACTKLADLTPPKMNPNTFVTNFYQMVRRGEVGTDVIVTDTGRRKVQGITLLKMPSATTILHNNAAQRKSITKPKPIDMKETLGTLTNTQEYLKKKNVLREISEKLSSSGFIPEEVLNVKPDPFGEEAVLLMDLVERATAALNQVLADKYQMEIDLEAEKEINKRYAAKLQLTPETLHAEGH